MKKVINIISNPKKMICALANRGLFNWLSDKKFLELYYYCKMGKKLDLENPKTYNEKLQWLKLYDRNELYCKLVDKYQVRQYIKSTIGEKYLVPMIKMYESEKDINWNELPNEFVIKCTHGSASVIVCKNKNELNINYEKEKLKKWLSKNVFYYGREWPYKHLEPRIICEKLLKDKNGKIPEDYKIFCFNGEPVAISIHDGRFTEDYTHDIYDIDWKKLNVRRGIKNSNKIKDKPVNFDEMLEISRVLSKGLKHVRVDLYNLDGKIYFGELTFFTASGFQGFEPNEYDYIWGDLITID